MFECSHMRLVIMNMVKNSDVVKPQLGETFAREEKGSG